jgi:putative ABC transport system substrate-binding protein
VGSSAHRHAHDQEPEGSEAHRRREAVAARTAASSVAASWAAQPTPTHRRAPREALATGVAYAQGLYHTAVLFHSPARYSFPEGCCDLWAARSIKNNRACAPPRSRQPLPTLGQRPCAVREAGNYKDTGRNKCADCCGDRIAYPKRVRNDRFSYSAKCPQAMPLVLGRATSPHSTRASVRPVSPSGGNVTIEFRWAEYDYERLPALAADLVRRKVSVIFAIGAVNTTFAAKEATTTIPIVFTLGSDPVELGIVASLNRPGGNLTGTMVLGTKLIPKRLEMLRELIPNLAAVGVLTNPNNPTSTGSIEELRAVARTTGMTCHIVPVASEADFEAAFATFDRLKVGGVLHTTDAVFTTRYDRMSELAARYRLPSINDVRESTDDGGLMNYGADVSDGVRRAAGYVGRILKGEKAGELPVQQSTKVELVINLKTAKALGLTIPLSLLGRADEVIE